MENNPPSGLNLPPLPKTIPGYPQLDPISVYAPFEHPLLEENDTPLKKALDLITSRKVTDVVIGLVLIVLLVPSTMALASWNAVPGDMTYPWKISLEKSLLFALSPSQELSGSTQVAFTQRRFSEATKMLSSDQAELGLTNLTAQVMTTSDSIKGINSKSAKKELTDKYIADLIAVNKKLEQEKLARRAQKLALNQAGTGGTTAQLPNSQNQNTQPINNQAPNAQSPNNNLPPSNINPTLSKPNNLIPTQAPANQSNPDVDKEIDSAQQIIEDTIKELSKNTQNKSDEPTSISPTQAPTVAPTEKPAPDVLQAIPTAVPQVRQMNSANNNNNNDQKENDNKDNISKTPSPKPDPTDPPKENKPTDPPEEHRPTDPPSNPQPTP